MFEEKEIATKEKLDGEACSVAPADEGSAHMERAVGEAVKATRPRGPRAANQEADKAAKTTMNSMLTEQGQTEDGSGVGEVEKSTEATGNSDCQDEEAGNSDCQATSNNNCQDEEAGNSNCQATGNSDGQYMSE